MKIPIAPPTEREREIVKRMDDTCLYYEFEHFTGENYLMWHRRRRCCRNTGVPDAGSGKKFLALFEKLMAQTVQEDGVRTDQ